MPGTTVANQGEGGGVMRYFRISNKDTLEWVGNNVDATPSGLRLLTVERPQDITVQEPDKQTQSGYIKLNYGDQFRLVLSQDSRIETGTDILRRLMSLPGVASGDGAAGVAAAIAGLVRDLISRVRVSITASATASLYRTQEDGGGTIVVLSTALTTVDGELDPDDLGGIKFNTRIRMDGGVQGPIPDGQIKDEEKRESASGGTGENFNFTIGDSAYIKMLPVGTKPVTISITLEADISPVVNQADINKFIDDIKGQLRQFGVVTTTPGGENMNPPQPQPGQDNATFLQQVAGFGASLLGAFQAILNVVLDSIKNRIIGALVTQTVWTFEFAENVPGPIRTQLQLAGMPDSAEKPYADLVVEEKPTGLAGEPGRSVRVIRNGSFGSEMMPFIERVVAGNPFDAGNRLSIALAFPRAIEAELAKYPVEEVRAIATAYRPLFEIPANVDLRELSKDQLVAAFKRRDVKPV